MEGPARLKIRVLQCIPSLLGGGAERQFCYLAAGLVERGHEVHVAYNHEGPNFALLQSSGARIHRIRARGALDPRAAFDIAGILRRERVQLVQTWLRRMDIWGGVAAQLAGVPWLLTERSQSVSIEERTPSARALRALAPRAVAVVANSENAAEIWRRGVGDRLPVRVVHNAIPVDRIEPLAPADRRELGFPEGAPLVLFAGRFAQSKNVPQLGAALAGLMRERPDVHALMLGEGPELGAFREWVRGQGLARRIVLPGYRDDLFRWMKAATLFVSPSRIDGMPNVVMEAMACGCPLVLSDIAPHREFVAAPEALWFGTEDVDALRDRLAESLADPAAARRRADLALASIRRFSVDAMVGAYDAVYQHLLGHA
ncbi:MAG: hypothetical protein JWM10_2933 [Myxococcaceae bacterium]|nr:hypothetical protein [Myxococcaceae bacterium]